MKNAIVIYPTRGQGYACAISFPKALVKSFRALFSCQDDRAWQEPVWCFKKVYLSAVQAWATQCAEEQQLVLHDVTGMVKGVREQALAEIWQQEYEEHIVAMIEVLPKLPPGALTLTRWFSTHLVFDLETFLGKALFEELKQAAYPQAKIPKSTVFIPTQGSHTVRLYAAPDPRLLHALIPLRINNFQALHLTMAQAFEQGSVHFRDQDDRLWFGASSAMVVGSSYDLHTPDSLGLPYSVTEINGAIYQVVQPEIYLERYWNCSAPAHVIDMNHPSSSELVSFIEHFSLASWLHAYVSQLIESSLEVLTPYPQSTHMQRWRSGDLWIHPVDGLFRYLQRTDRGPLLTLLGWDEERFQQLQGALTALKVQKAEHYYLSCLEHAVEVMQADLQERQRIEIQELAARYGLALALSTKKRMISKCTDPRMARDVLGLTEEWQVRTGGFVPFEDGVIWGQRTAYKLNQALRTGYLSDGRHTLSGLAAERVPSWYVLWEGWPPLGELARMQWSPHQLIEQAEMELVTCRWFVYPGNHVPSDNQQEATNSLDTKKALALLTDGFRIVRPDVAKELCRLLGIPFTEDLIEHDYVINELISTRDGHEAGVDCLMLGYYAIKVLDLGDAPGMVYSNRAMQAVANTNLLKRALHLSD